MNFRHLKLAGLTTGLSTVFSTLAFSAMAQQNQEGYYNHPPMWGGGYGGWGHGLLGGPLMVLGALVLIALVVMGVARLMGCSGGRCGHRHSGSGALALLEERFAKGEIDKTEFEERRKALKP